MAQYGIAAVFNSHTSGGVFQSSMRLSKFSLRLNVKFLIVNGKLCPDGIEVFCSKRERTTPCIPQKRAGRAPTSHRRYTDVIQILKNHPVKRLIHLANPGASA